MSGTFQADVPIVVANVVVEINLGVVPLSISPLEAGPQDMAIVDADVLGRVVESHVVVEIRVDLEMYVVCSVNEQGCWRLVREEVVGKDLQEEMRALWMRHRRDVTQSPKRCR